MKMNRLKKIGVASLFFFPLIVHASKNNDAHPCPDIVVAGTNVACYGESTGTASVTVSNGSGNYSYSWTNGENTGSISGLKTGTYAITVKDNVSGCTVTGAYVVTSPDPIALNDFVVQDVKCYGENTGSISVTPKGGTPPYTYSWYNSSSSEVSTNPTLTNAYADEYTLEITDARDCIYSRKFILNEPNEALAASADITNASCFSQANGKIDLEVWGGTPSYNFLWNNGATSEDVKNITSGNYSVEITDLNGCKLDLNYFVTQPPVLTGIISAQDVVCHGGTSGKVNIEMQGGTLPYTYQWNNSVTTFVDNSETLENIPASDYRVVVNDQNGCEYIDYVTVFEPTKLTVSHTYKDIDCYGGNDGYINLGVSGGVPNYSYVWTNSAGVTVGSGQNLPNMTADIYTVIVTDGNNCQETITQELTQPSSPIEVIETIVDVKCYGENTGSIGLQVTGGTQPYNYLWSTGETTESISNLPADVYTYQISDANFCTYSQQMTITQPLAPLSVTYLKTDVSCYGESNGVINLTVGGGTAPYSYEWNNSLFELSNVTPELENYPADFYAYRVSDANNCKLADTIEITEPPLLQSDIFGVDILCKGGNNGSVTLNTYGGVLPYQFTWSNSQVTESIAGLTAGYYEVEIKDAHDCITTNHITLTEPEDSLHYDFEKKDVLCYDGNDGEISIEVAGGTLPYLYQWSNGDTLRVAKSLSAGMYVFLVTDHNDCVLIDSILIEQPNELMLNEVVTPVSCYGGYDGGIDITPTGGTFPFQFKWFNSKYVLAAQTEDLENLPADIYQLEIIDSNNCFNEVFIEVFEPDLLTISYTTDVVKCNGEGSGNIFVTIEGGNPTYTTLWSTGEVTQDLLNVPSGVYSLAVVDQKGCKDSIEVNMTEPDPITVTFDVTAVSCIDQYDGTAQAHAKGGNGGYLYAWSTGDYTSYVEDLNAEIYYVDIVDVLGCHTMASVTIPSSDSDCVEPVTAFTPNGDNYNDVWEIDNMYLYPEATVKIYNKWGNLVHDQSGVYQPWDGKTKGVSLPSGVYYYIIHLNKENREPLTGNITIIK